MFELAGKNIVVTGATGGLGAAITKVLHAQGANVLLTGTNNTKLDNLVSTLGERSCSCKCDLSNIEEVEGLLDIAIDKLGSVDVLICNAGITKDGLAIRMKNDDFESVMKVNLESTFILNRNFVRHMMKNRKGRIVNVSSVVAVSGNPGQANYCASKAGIIGMSKSLAREVASRGITINCIAPGFIKTPMTNVLNDEQKQKIAANIPSGELGDPTDIAYATLYLVSDEARYVNGQTLHVNGGMLMI
jgi:3-oxoacyl-[acyl-carrier protein] reductase